jgi:hypothetical protein
LRRILLASVLIAIECPVDAPLSNLEANNVLQVLGDKGVDLIHSISANQVFIVASDPTPKAPMHL